MTDKQAELLLGGFATGTLSAEENEKLMQAALRNQALFDALMDEAALKEALDDPETRLELLRALQPLEPRVAWYQLRWVWAAAATAFASIALLLVLRLNHVPLTEPMQMAKQASTPEFRTPATLPPAETQQPKPELNAVPAPRPPVAATSGAIASQNEQSKKKAEEQVARDVAVPAPAAAPAAEKTESYSANRSEALGEPAKKQSAAVGSVAEQVSVNADAVAQAPVPPALKVNAAFQQPDGSWQAAQSGGSVPAGRQVRLSITSPISGIISTSPALTPPRPVKANETIEVYVPARAAGELNLSVELRLQDAAQRQANQPMTMALRDGAPARADANRMLRKETPAAAAKESKDAAPPPALVQVIRLRIE